MKTILFLALVWAPLTFAQNTWNNGLTPLQELILDGDVHGAKSLIHSYPEEVHALTKKGTSPLTSDSIWSTLQIAVIAGQEQIIAEIIKHKPDLNYQDPFHGFTALHLAAQRDHGGMELLLKGGANLHLQATDTSCAGCVPGADAMMMAIDFDNLPALKLLLQYGADPVRLQGKYKENSLNGITYISRCHDAFSPLECVNIRMQMLEAVINYKNLDVNNFNIVHGTSPLAQLSLSLPRPFNGAKPEELEWSKIVKKGIYQLVERGADLCQRSNFGTPMAILSRGIDVNEVIAQMHSDLSSRYQCK